MRAIFAACGLALLMCLPVPAIAEAPACHGKDLTGVAGLAAAEAQRADDLVNADGVFWRIDRTGLEPGESTERVMRRCRLRGRCRPMRRPFGAYAASPCFCLF